MTDEEIDTFYRVKIRKSGLIASVSISVFLFLMFLSRGGDTGGGWVAWGE